MSSTLFDLLSQQVMSGGLDRLQAQLGGADEATTRKAVPAALGTLLGALAKNSAKSDGAEALFGALQRDHDGSLLDDLPGYLSAPQESVGNGILKHALGGNRDSVTAGLGKQLGLDAGSTTKLLAMLAPLVMGALGRAQRQNNLDANSMASMLGGERQAVKKGLPEGLGGLGAFLDQDGDGQITDDVAKIVGKGLLKNLFGRR